MLTVFFFNDESSEGEILKVTRSKVNLLCQTVKMVYKKELMNCMNFVNVYSVKISLELMLYCFIMCRIKIKFSYLINGVSLLI